MGFLSRLFSIAPEPKKVPLHFFNTLGKSLQEFTLPAQAKLVRMYNCGPTVYDRQHIGNLSAAVFADTIRRVLSLNDYEVKQVINITDFGHLVSDSDDGEDKMTKGMKREKLALTMENMRVFATKYMNAYLDDIKALNVEVEKIQFPRASDHVETMVAMIQTLMEKGYAYQIKDGVYFDTAKFPEYGALGGINLAGQLEGARVAANSEKRSGNDFALWKAVGSRSKIGWPSPWGKGFPGWHLECSAMINDLLGKQIDIHTGGIEHVAIHHNNEIAQSEAAIGRKPLSRFWLHREHIRMEGAKLAKSTGNTAYLSEVAERGIHPLALRYWFLTAHYRQPANFTWEALEAAQKAYLQLHKKYKEVSAASEEYVPTRVYQKFHERINDDLDTPGAIASLWEAINSDKYSPSEIKSLLAYADSALGLGLKNSDTFLDKLVAPQEALETSSLTSEVKTLLEERENARKNKDWVNADLLREKIEALGFSLKDTPQGPLIYK